MLSGNSSFQFSFMRWSIEKAFLELVDQNSEVFLSLGRYSLLFEQGFCEHCNINSLTLKNLKASDSVNRSDSFLRFWKKGSSTPLRKCISFGIRKRFMSGYTLC